MNLKKLLKAVCIPAAFVLALSGCLPESSSKTAQNNTPAPAGTTAPAASEKPKNVTMRFMWWGGDARHKATLKVIEMYSAANPGVKIEAEYGGMDGYYQKLVTQLSSGTEPDIIQIVPEWFLPLGKSGNIFYNLGSKTNLLDISGFDKNYLNKSCTINGQIQGLPTGSNGSVMAINKNFFTKNGIDPATKWDWDNLKKIGTEIHQKNKDDYLLGAHVDGASTAVSHLLKYHVMQQSGVTGWVNDDWKLGFKEEHLVNSFNYFLDLLKSGVMQPIKETSVYKSPVENPRWISNQVGMMHSMPSTLSIYASDKVDLWAVPVPVKSGAADTGVVSGPPQFITVSAKSKNTEEAVKFVNYFFNNKDAVLALGTVRGPQPTKTASDILLQANQISKLDFEAIKVVNDTASKNFNLKWLTTEFETPYNDICNKVLFGSITPEQGAKEMIKEFNAAAETLKSK